MEGILYKAPAMFISMSRFYGKARLCSRGKPRNPRYGRPGNSGSEIPNVVRAAAASASSSRVKIKSLIMEPLCSFFGRAALQDHKQVTGRRRGRLGKSGDRLDQIACLNLLGGRRRSRWPKHLWPRGSWSRWLALIFFFWALSYDQVLAVFGG